MGKNLSLPYALETRRLMGICIYIYLYIPSRFFENQPNEIGSHLNEKGSNDTFLKPKKFQNHSNEAKGKEEKKERGEGKEEKKKKQWLHS